MWAKILKTEQSNYCVVTKSDVKGTCDVSKRTGSTLSCVWRPVKQYQYQYQASVFRDLQCQGQRVLLGYSLKVKDDTSVQLQEKWQNLK